MTGVRVAVIGCGPWGRNHVRVFNQLGLLRLVCDEDEQTLAALREDVEGIETCTSLDDALSRNDVDAVVIATPVPTHAEFALSAMEAGKDVLVEKPLATSLFDAERIQKAAQTTGAIVAVGHVFEYHPAVSRLCELVQSGELGKLRYLYSHRLNFGRVRTGEDAMWSFAPHDIGLFLRIIGVSPHTVAVSGGSYLSTGVSDVTLMSMSFANDVHAHIFVSWLHPFRERRLVAVGDRQMAVFDDAKGWSEKLVLYPHRVDWKDGRIPIEQPAEASPVDLQEKEPLLAQAEHFVECVESRRVPLTGIASATNVLRVLDLGGQSLAAGGAPRAMQPAAAAAQIHPTAAIDSDVEIGKGTRIWHHVHLMSGVRIGQDCVLGQNVFVGRDVRIGDRVKIQNNVSVYEGVELEDEVFCGPSCVFTNVRRPRSVIDQKDSFVSTRVRRGASIGANSTIVCGVTIGPHALVAAGAVVTTDVPAHALVVGSPARVVGAICVCGQTLVDDGSGANCPECGRAYAREGDGGLAAV